MAMKKCECEHCAHTDTNMKPATPNGNPGHAYGQSFHEHYMQRIETAFGPFWVCKDCANDCHASEV